MVALESHRSQSNRTAAVGVVPVVAQRVCGLADQQAWLCIRAVDIPLEHIAHKALDWTSRVSIEMPDAVLLEVAGSRRLFGGLENLRTEIERVFPGVYLALAPTPRAALWLARGRPGAWIESTGRLAGALGDLAVSVLRLDNTLAARLHGFGVRTVCDLIRLPRDAMARRTGQALNDALRQALGESPDPRGDWKPAPRYSGHRELEFETESDVVLLRAVEPLFIELMTSLRATGRGVRRCTILLSHREAPPTRIRIGLLEPVREPARLREQLTLHLQRTELSEPVLAVALHASRLEPVAELAHDLFAPRTSGEGWRVLLERLRTRLGDGAVFSLGVQADHRPERAWVRSGCEAQTRFHVAGRVAPRPTWLLSAPKRVSDAGCYRLLRGPERIESGWWDGEDVRRDYFVAQDGHGVRCWMFQERRAPYHWFLHGFFG